MSKTNTRYGIGFIKLGRCVILVAIVIVVSLQFRHMGTNLLAPIPPTDHWQFLTMGTKPPGNATNVVPRSYRRKYARTNPLRIDAKTAKSVAILIAGQCHRFIYRDQSGPLFRTADKNTLFNYEIDVYIALQCGSVIPSYLGTVDEPPYMKRMNDTDIAAWYLARGANTVTIEIIDTHTMDGIISDIAYQATTLVRELDDFDVAEVPAWHAELRKFYMRHFVFAMSQQTPTTRQYDAYVFNREDNYYLKPLDLESHYFGRNNRPTNEPFVIVDAYCEFRAYSDKMYIANHLGASLIFSSTKAEFVHWMKRFLLVGLFQKRHSYWYPYQAEAFVHDTLNSVIVERIDLHRLDVRYNGRIKCVPNLYYVCMSNVTIKMAKTNHLGTCGGLLKKPKLHWIFADNLP